MSGSLVVAKKENFVFLYWATHCSAKLVLNVDAAGWGIVVPCIQAGVAQKLEDVAVKAVGSGLGDDVDLTAAVVAVFCIEVIGNNAKLSDRVKVWNQRGAVVHAFLRISSIDHESIGARSAAVDGLSSVGKIAGYSGLRQAGALGQPSALVGRDAWLKG